MGTYILFFVRAFFSFTATVRLWFASAYKDRAKYFIIFFFGCFF